MSTRRPFFREPLLRFLIIGFLFIAAFALRLYQIDEQPMSNHASRQYHSALLARYFYERLLSGESRSMPPDGIIEPPLMELSASLAYYISGGEHLWIPCLLSAAVWMVGGVFLYLIAKKIASPNAAVFSLSFYLFDPAIVLLSRAFMPDPLMITLLLISVFTILRYHEQPSTQRLLIAAGASSLALFVKPGICFFQVFGAFISLMIYKKGVPRSLTSSHLLLFAVLSVLPVGLYYLYGTVLEGFLRGQAGQKVLPWLLLQGRFWQSWLALIGHMVGYVPLLGALVGVSLFRAGSPRALMMGLWGGYFLFGLLFTRHIHTHDYYSLQLVPVAALSLGPVGAGIIDYVKRVDLSYYRRGAILGIFLLAVVLGVVDQRATISGIAQQGQGKAFPGRYVGPVSITDYGSRAETYQKIGEVVDHSRHTIFVAPDLGYPLIHHGRLDGEYWHVPRRLQRQQSGTERRFNALYNEGETEYFIVVKYFAPTYETVAWSSEEYQGLRRLLFRNFPVLARDDDYIVFDLRNSDYGDRQASSVHRRTV